MKDYGVDTSDSAPTPALVDFRRAYDADDNVWRVIGCGHHQNLFDAACDRIDELEAVVHHPKG